MTRTRVCQRSHDPRRNPHPTSRACHRGASRVREAGPARSRAWPTERGLAGHSVDSRGAWAAGEGVAGHEGRSVMQTAEEFAKELSEMADIVRGAGGIRIPYLETLDVA